MKRLLLASLVLLDASCVRRGADPIGLAPSEPGIGPKIRWDLQARPLPEIPFPNDAATWPDPDSPTGMRVNASMISPTGLESTLRAHVDELDGFGIFAPLSLEFTDDIDVASLRGAQK